MRYINLAPLAMFCCFNAYSELIENNVSSSSDSEVLKDDNLKTSDKSFTNNNLNSNKEQFRTKRELDDDINYPIKAVVINSQVNRSSVIKNRCASKDAYKLSSFNEAAMLFAGLSQYDNSAYKEYSKKITERWGNLDKICFNKLKIWRDNNLSTLDDKKFIFYPFGGPDIAYVVMLFPHANSYVLVGQETAGNGDALLESCTNETLVGLEKSEDHFFKKGYFVTSYMSADLNNRAVKGVLPIALLTLSKLGYEIVSVENLKLVSDKNDSIKIVFKDITSNLEKTLFYIRCDLCDTSNNLSNLFEFVSSKFGRQFVTFLKSSSYSLHRKLEFSKLKRYVLNNSSAILQDDTGVKFKDIDKNIFEVRLFGSYKCPTLKVFKNFIQLDLVDAYKKYKVSPLDFGIGYICDYNALHQNYDNINLQLYVKQKINVNLNTANDTSQEVRDTKQEEKGK